MGDYTISKYQPELYDDTGCYRRNEWTSVGDIGKTFHNGVLSIDEYMKVEQRYIDAAITLARLSGCTYLIINSLTRSAFEQTKIWICYTNALFLYYKMV